MKIRVDSPNRQHLSVLWDIGASISLISNWKAKARNLVGKHLDLSITKVDEGEETIPNK